MRKKLGLTLASEKSDGERNYRIVTRKFFSGSSGGIPFTWPELPTVYDRWQPLITAANSEGVADLRSHAVGCDHEIGPKPL